jgi:hypothetical protein
MMPEQFLLYGPSYAAPEPPCVNLVYELCKVEL